MNLNLLLIITAVILLCMVVDGYKKGMVRSLISLISLLITCVVLFLLGNALSSYFDGRFFNVIITLLLLAAIGLLAVATWLGKVGKNNKMFLYMIM